MAGWLQQGAGILVTFFSLRCLMRTSALLEEEVGLWLAIQTSLAIIGLTDFGIGIVLGRQAAFTIKRTASSPSPHGDFLPTSPGWDGLSELYHATQKLFAWLFVIAILILATVYHLVLPLGKLAPLLGNSTMITWYLAGFGAIFSLQSKLYQGFLDGLGYVYLSRLIGGLGQIVLGGGIILTLTWSPGLMELGLVALATGLIQSQVMKFALFRIAAGRLNPKAREKKLALKGVLKVAVPLGMVSVAAYLVNSIQVPMVAAMLGAVYVAPFFLAQRINQVLTMAATQLLYPQLPLFTQDVSGGKQKTAHHRMSRTLIMFTGAVLVGNLVFLLASPTLVTWWVGPGKYPATSILILMSIDSVIMCSAAAWGHFVIASGNNPFVISTILNGTGNILFCLVLSPFCGLLGIPLASLISGLLTNYWYNPLKGVQLLKCLHPKQRPARDIRPLTPPDCIIH